MNVKKKIQSLRVALAVIGFLFIFGLYPLMHYWPSSWAWIPSQAEYEQMILGIYATLGVFLLIASKNPIEHLSLLWFTAWSSLVHSGIMFIQALVDPGEHPNLYGDVPALFIIAILLFILTPRKKELHE
ncbi:MAG: DUF6632 domain-containing protein [Waddliaceae bacterium]